MACMGITTLHLFPVAAAAGNPHDEGLLPSSGQMSVRRIRDVSEWEYPKPISKRRSESTARHPKSSQMPFTESAHTC